MTVFDVISARASPFYSRWLSIQADRAHQPPRTRHRMAPKHDHVLLVVIDCLRPDHRPDIPIDFSTAVAPAPWTFPSVSSYHTGLRPSEHGAVVHDREWDGDFAMPEQTQAEPVLPTAFEAAGFDTYLGSGFMMPFQAVQGWYQTHRTYSDVRAERVIDGYRSWRNGRDRTFAYLHLGDLHAPIQPPDNYVRDAEVDESLTNLPNISMYNDDFDVDDPECQYYRDHKLRLYGAALQYVSDRLTYLVEDIGEDTVVVVTGDHGEALWDHQELDKQFTDSRPRYGLGHGGTPLDSVARVPVSMSIPGSEPALPVGGRGSLRDIPKTLLTVAFGDSDAPGESWTTRISEDRAVVSEGSRYGAERKAVYRGDYKLIQSVEDDVILTARIDESGEWFEAIPADVELELLDALPDAWDVAETVRTPSRFVQGQLEALGYQ